MKEHSIEKVSNIQKLLIYLALIIKEKFRIVNRFRPLTSLETAEVSHNNLVVDEQVHLTYAMGKRLFN